LLDTAALLNRLDGIRERIARAAERAGRDPSSVRLVAVSKTFDAAYVRAAASAGQVDFGENKVQEALGKMDQLADLPLRWHLIGHLQSNKAKKAAERFHAIHAVDSASLGDALERTAAGLNRQIEALVQVDLVSEPTKHGAREDDLLDLFEAAKKWQAVRVVGLMLLPPAVEDADEARPYFKSLLATRDRLIANGVDRAMLRELSMGMSHDFEVAIEEGATMVRVGTAIFGSRE
jgi:pyridoxal phosphate enzyme (YggS family)